MTLATRMAVMKGGVIQQFGTPAEVYARPENLFVATFLGTPPMNLLRGTLAADEGKLWFRGPELSVDVTNYAFKGAPDLARPCVLGVRPEDVRAGGRGGAQGQGQTQLSGSVTLVEPMGNHRVLWLDYHGVQIASIDQDKAPLASGAPVSFEIDVQHVSLFDEASGQRL
jgi:multiple sugar transport system ATP-binding protein